MINETQAKKYCSDDISKIENYEKAIADNTQMWHCHHRLQIQGKFKNSTELLKKCGLYYSIPAWQLIFMTHREHISLHNLGKHHTVETKLKMSEAQRGKQFSIETRQKLSEAHCGKSAIWNKGKPKSVETRRKMSETNRGKHAWNKGKEFSVETRRKMSEAQRGKHYWNNGVINKRSKECPGPEWKKGRFLK